MFSEARRQGLTDIVADQLRTAIVAGQFTQSGTLPTESALAESFGVSRSVVREAVKRLETLGLVETHQGRRSRIREIDPSVAIDSVSLMLERCHATPQQLLEVRHTLELDIAEMAAQRRTLAQLRAIGEAVEQQACAGTTEDKVRWDLCFHQRLAEATGNPLYCQMLATVSQLLRASLFRTIAFHGGDRSVTGHQQIVDAVERRMPQDARQAMHDHLTQAAHDHIKLSQPHAESQA